MTARSATTGAYLISPQARERRPLYFVANRPHGQPSVPLKQGGHAYVVEGGRGGAICRVVHGPRRVASYYGTHRRRRVTPTGPEWFAR
jgi:hypothetical protein